MQIVCNNKENSCEKAIITNTHKKHINQIWYLTLPNTSHEYRIIIIIKLVITKINNINVVINSYEPPGVKYKMYSFIIFINVADNDVSLNVTHSKVSVTVHLSSKHFFTLVKIVLKLLW